MGEIARTLAGKNIEALQSALKRSTADEWHAHYNFQFLAWTLAGHRAPAVVDLLKRFSTEALERAERLARRLCELGGRPPKRLSEVVSSATDKPFKAPDDPTDVAGALRAVLDATRTSARAYESLWRESRETEPVTAALAATFLTDALRDEETMERLLGDPAPGLTGG